MSERNERRREAEIETLRGRVAELLAANERLRREAAGLAGAEDRRRLLASALEAVRQGVAITDAHLAGAGPRLLFVNDSLCEMSGYRPQDLIGQPIRRLLAADLDSGTWSRIEEELRAGRSFRGEFRHRRRDGNEYLVSDHISPVFGADGALTHLVSIQQDVTEEKRSREALRRSEERYRLLIERMNEGFLATDADNRIDLVNAKVVEMLGLSRRELEGRYLGELFDDENRARLEAQEERRRRGVAEPYELVWTATDGRRIDTVVSPTSLQGADGAFVGSFAVVTDITERKRSEADRRQLEARIRKTQKMESLGLLAGGIAHDFNNLLVGILGNAGLALMEMPEESPVRHLVRQIETAAVRASELTHEMLAYSGRGRLSVEPIDLSTLVREMAQLLRSSISKKATLRFEFVDDLPAIDGDATQIRQVVMNLITNASEALGEESGVITLETGEIFADEEYLESAYMDDGLGPQRFVVLEVTDTGTGMCEDTRSRIFDPFFTTKFTGRGLGLAAVLGIVRGHRGAIRVASEQGGGTSFQILFPPSERAPDRGSDREAEPAVEAPDFLGSGRVLVADDEELVRRVARRSLEGVGYSVLLAADGAEAVEVFRREADRIDAVLLDMTMPRMGGEEVYREIRRLGADVKIVLTSGFSEQDAIRRFQGDGLDGFLQKPFKPRELVDKMREIFAA